MTWSDRTTAPAFLLVTRFLFLDGLFFTHTKNLTSLACSCTTHCLWNSVIELLCSKSESGCKDKKFSNLLPNFPESFFSINRRIIRNNLTPFLKAGAKVDTFLLPNKFIRHFFKEIKKKNPETPFSNEKTRGNRKFYLFL